MRVSYRSTLITGAAMLSVLLMSGCVSSEHPPSDGRPAALDERLIGIWRCLSAGESDTPSIFAIGRHPDQPNRLEVMSLTVDKGHVEVHRGTLYTTELGGRWYASVPDGELGYLVGLYEVDPGGTARLYAMDATALRKAIDSGRLAGRVEKEWGGLEPGVRITAEPGDLATFLVDAGTAAFDPAVLWNCRRLDTK